MHTEYSQVDIQWCHLLKMYLLHISEYSVISTRFLCQRDFLCHCLHLKTTYATFTFKHILFTFKHILHTLFPNHFRLILEFSQYVMEWWASGSLFKLFLLLGIPFPSCLYSLQAHMKHACLSLWNFDQNSQVLVICFVSSPKIT